MANEDNDWWGRQWSGVTGALSDVGDYLRPTSVAPGTPYGVDDLRTARGNMLTNLGLGLFTASMPGLTGAQRAAALGNIPQGMAQSQAILRNGATMRREGAVADDLLRGNTAWDPRLTAARTALAALGGGAAPAPDGAADAPAPAPMPSQAPAPGAVGGPTRLSGSGYAAPRPAAPIISDGPAPAPGGGETNLLQYVDPAAVPPAIRAAQRPVGVPPAPVSAAPAPGSVNMAAPGVETSAVAPNLPGNAGPMAPLPTTRIPAAEGTPSYGLPAGVGPDVAPAAEALRRADADRRNSIARSVRVSTAEADATKLTAAMEDARALIEGNVPPAQAVSQAATRAGLTQEQAINLARTIVSSDPAVAAQFRTAAPAPAPTNAPPAPVEAAPAPAPAPAPTRTTDNPLTRPLADAAPPALRPVSYTRPATDGRGYYAALIDQESGGRLDAENRRSTARGQGQFIDSTWMSFAEARPDLFTGMSRQQILDARTQGEPSDIRGRQAAAMQWYAQRNAADLGAAGLPVTDTTIALAHGFGSGGAASLLRADPHTPVSQIVGDAVMRANPNLTGQTVGQVVGGFSNRFGSGSSFANGPFVASASASAPGGGGGGGAPAPVRNSDLPSRRPTSPDDWWTPLGLTPAMAVMVAEMPSQARNAIMGQLMTRTQANLPDRQMHYNDRTGEIIEAPRGTTDIIVRRQGTSDPDGRLNANQIVDAEDRAHQRYTMDPSVAKYSDLQRRYLAYRATQDDGTGDTRRIELLQKMIDDGVIMESDMRRASGSEGWTIGAFNRMLREAGARGGFLSNEQRQQMRRMMDVLYDNASNDYGTARDSAITRLRRIQGARPEEAIGADFRNPGLVETAGERLAARVTADDIPTMSPADINRLAPHMAAIAQRSPQAVEAIRRRIGASR
jgi:hypothetical protein